MREIKFRAWNSAENRMYPNVGIQPYKGKYCVIDENGVIYDMYGSAPTLMQYTGLKDNTKWEQLTKEEQKEWLKEHTKEEWNGREIYEHDIILRHVQWGNGSPEVVRYENGRWSYSYDLVEYVEEPSTQWEVIGNLYETPDLVRGTESEEQSQ